MENNYFYHMTLNKFQAMIYFRPDKITYPKRHPMLIHIEKDDNAYLYNSFRDPSTTQYYYVRITHIARPK